MPVFTIIRKKQRFFAATMAASIFVIYFVGEEKPDEAELPEIRIVHSIRKDED